MKKNLFSFLFALTAIVFTSCADYSDDLGGGGKSPIEDYVFFANSLAIEKNDTIYGGTNNEILFFMTNESDSIVATQIDFGDGSIDGGLQILHKYKNNGIYNLKITETKTGSIINRIVKIAAPSVTTKETIVQLSGNTIGDSASINLLCLKKKIWNFEKQSGQYFLKGDMTNEWKTAIAAVDTNFVYDGEVYLLFNFKVKNGQWYSFGCYKASFGGGEQWSYDPLNRYWDTSRGLYKFFVANATIYQNELTAQIPGICGDAPTSASGPVIRLDYQTNNDKPDSLVIYANRNYLGADSTKLGISYSVDGGDFIKKIASFNKTADYIYVKVPVDKNSTIRFKTYSDITNLITGNMTGSRFYDSSVNDCYLKIAGSGLTSRSIAELDGFKGIKLVLLNGETILYK